MLLLYALKLLAIAGLLLLGAGALALLALRLGANYEAANDLRHGHAPADRNEDAR